MIVRWRALAGWAHPRSALDPLLEEIEGTALGGVDSPEEGPAAVVGWSMGGIQALEAAIERPEAVRALVLISSTARFLAGSEWPGTPHAGLRAMRRAFRSDRRSVLRRFFVDCAAPFVLRDGEVERRVELAAAAPPGALEMGLDYLGAADLRGGLGALEVPCLVIHGRQDRIIPCEAGEKTAAAIPGARFEAIPGLGHDLPLRRPDLVASLVRRFLDGPSV